MKKNIILSVIGPDKSGIVSDISKFVKAYSGNIEKSRMVRLEDYFTIMVQINIQKDKIKNLEQDLTNYSNYTFSIHSLESANNNENEDIHTVYLKGIDSEGIVYKITNEFAKLNINIEELETNLENAPMSGLSLFSLKAKISHARLNLEALKKTMDKLAAELDVNINIEN